MKLLARPYIRFGIALLAVGAGAMLRYFCTLWVGPGLPTYVTFFPAVMLAAIMGGFWPGVAATLVSALTADFWLLTPMGLGIRSLVDGVGMLLFIAMGVFISLLAERYRRIRDSLFVLVTARTQELDDAYEVLKQQIKIIDPVRAEVILEEMQRVLKARRGEVHPPPSPAIIGLKRAPSIIGVAVAFMGILVLIGWMFGLTMITSVLPGLNSMKVNTALCFVSCGAALVFREKRYFRFAFAVLPLAVGAITILEYMTGINVGIDQLMFRDPGNTLTEFPGRMALFTACSFLFISISIILLRTRFAPARLSGQILALGAGIIGFISLLGYIYGDKELYRLVGASEIALSTAAAFVALAAGLILARDDGISAIVTGSGPGSELARWLLPTVILIPAILGWLAEQGVTHGWYGERLDTGLLALAMIISLAVVAGWSAHLISRADRSRRENEAHLHNQAKLMDQSHDALIIREVNGAIRFWNGGAASLYGWTAAEALGQRIHVLLHTEGLPADNDATLARVGHWEGELTHRRRGGDRVIVESSKTAMPIDGGVLVLESNRDITGRKRDEEELRTIAEDLRRSNKDLEQFAYVASHDLQEPLRAVAGFLGLLKKQYGESLDAAAREYIDVSVQGAERMQRLVLDLLSYSRIGTVGKEFAPVPLRDAVDEAQALLQFAIRENNAVITCGELPEVHGDRTQLTRLLENLIGNGVKFHGPRTPEICINAAHRDDGWVISVHDNGIGIEKQYFDRIFLIFQRLHSRSVYSGTGIGLAVCKRIVEHHNGSIWLESVPGEGSTFFFSIPDRGGGA
ncbi:MAG: ATP-binding protein [Spirochaetota bacterium]